MLDSLDLGLLKSQIFDQRKAARRTWTKYIIIMCALLALLYWIAGTPCSKCSLTALEFLKAMLPFFAMFAMLAALGTFYINLRRRQKHAKVIGQNLPALNLPPAIKSYESKISIGVVIFLILVGLIFKLNLWDLIPLFLTAIFIFMMSISFIGIWMRAPLFRANYAETVRRSQIAQRCLRGNPAILLSESLALIFAGKTDESEKVLQQMIVQTRQEKVYDWVAYNNYGVELTYQARYEESLPLLEAAIKLQPHIGNAYDSLAQWYLSQNAFSERALELADFGLQLPITYTSGLRENVKSLRLVTRAWAEARTGQKETAQLTLTDAMRSSNSRYIPVLAETHRLAGETYIALGDADKARDHFQKAAKLDPNGRIGKLAQAALERLTSDQQ